MPQTFVALQCAFCNTFQGQLDKKAKKFTCVVCNAKQSFRTVFAVSNSGEDIRLTVQQLNELRGAQDDLKGSQQVQHLQQQVVAQQDNEPAVQTTTQHWQEFAAEDAGSGDDDAAAGETGFVTSLPEAQLGKRQQRAAGFQQGKGKRAKQLSSHDSSSLEPERGMQQQWPQHQVSVPQHRPSPSTVAQTGVRRGQQGVANIGTGNSGGQPVPGWHEQPQQPDGPGQQQQQRQPLQRLPQQGRKPQQQGYPAAAGSSWQNVEPAQLSTGPKQWETQQHPGTKQQQQAPAWPLAQRQGQQGWQLQEQWQPAPPKQQQEQQQERQSGPQHWQAQHYQQQGWQQQQPRQWPQQQQPQQQQAWQRQPTQKPSARLPGASKQAAPAKPGAAAAAAAAAGASKAAVGAWSAFVDDDQAAGDCSDDEGGGMCFVTDADTAGQWA